MVYRSRLLSFFILTVTEENQHDYPRKVGNTMVLLAWVAFIIVLYMLFAGLQEQDFNPNQQINGGINEGVAEVVLLQNRAGHYVATADFNGVPVDVMVDTGATYVSVPQGLANKIGLQRGAAMSVSTANGTILVYVTSIDSIALGQIKLNNVRANINPYMDDDFVLLGMSFLEQLEFSHSKGNLILRQY
jgi:aspartyl protease family protein